MAEVVTGKKGAPRVDMTPMVDLGFLLITFFMLTTTMANPNAMEINVPKDVEDEDDQPPLKQSRVVNLVMGEDDKIWWFQGLEEPEVNETNWSAEGVRKVLDSKRTEIGRDEKGDRIVVLIKPLKSSRYKNMVDILDEMAILGIKRYALVDATPEDSALVYGIPVEALSGENQETQE